MLCAVVEKLNLSRKNVTICAAAAAVDNSWTIFLTCIQSIALTHTLSISLTYTSSHLLTHIFFSLSCSLTHTHPLSRPTLHPPPRLSKHFSTKWVSEQSDERTLSRRRQTSKLIVVLHNNDNNNNNNKRSSFLVTCSTYLRRWSEASDGSLTRARL